MARSLVTGASLLSFPLRASGRNDRILREPATANGPTVLPRQYFRQCPGTRWYGNTKHGKYVGECAAIQDGNRPAYGKACGSNCQSVEATAPSSSPSAKATNEVDERTIRSMVDQAVARLNKGDVSFGRLLG